MMVSTLQNNQRMDALEIDWADGDRSVLPYLWLRDNCGCGDCRVVQTSEKKFMVSDVPIDLAPASIELVDDTLNVTWPDGHRSLFDGTILRRHGQLREKKWLPWPRDFEPPRSDYRSFLDDDQEAAQGISKFVTSGVLILEHAPTAPDTLEELASRLGPIRELLFARIHNVEVDAKGYNVAHTVLPLPPHNDFASYTWPPSVQALHMLENEAPGGESIVVDGWSVLRGLRDDHPEYFEVLCSMPVPFREFDDDNETFATAPIVRCDAVGGIAGLRFSNQLMQAIDPGHPAATGFYRAYHELCRRIMDPAARTVFRLHGGDILIVAAHRVLHGRESFEPIGRRRLQDAYFEFDNVRNHLVVLRRKGVISDEQ